MSDDIVHINSDEDDTESFKEKPITQLFMRLMSNENKQATVLTNSQIVEILVKELSINVWDIHELEGEIYLTITKKSLKDWPQWNEFDRNVHTLKSKKDNAALDQMLEMSYNNLKSFLEKRLEGAKVLVKKKMNEIIEEAQVDAEKNKADNKDNSVVLEVQCTREQLNEMIFRRPNPVLNDSIFNGVDIEQTVIKINRLPLEAILNWWDVQISIIKANTLYLRKTTHELSHVLVNKNLLSRYNPLKTLSQEIKVGQKSNHMSVASTYPIMSYIEDLKSENRTLVPLLNFIMRDIKLLPEKVPYKTTYYRYTNKYPYVRYLYKEVTNPDINSRKYDLQLEETISPQYMVHIGKLHHLDVKAKVEVECCGGKFKFTGASLLDELGAHFEERHAIDEPDWKCTNCGKTFTMPALAQNYWTHKC